MHNVKSIVIVLLSFLLIQSSVFAVSNESIGWGFKKGKNGQQADAGRQYEMLLEKYDAVYKSDPDQKILYLTFDNGYENGYTGQILDVLKEEKVPATFFVTGHYIKSATDLLKRMVDEGHIVGNHSWSHPDFTKVSDEKLKNELEKVKKQVATETGQKEMSYLRPPRGVFSERTLKHAKEEGYYHIFWSVAFVDWQTNKQKGSKYAYDSVMRQIHPGAIILLHTVSKDNAEALQKTIQDLKKDGYTFKSLDDLYLKQNFDVPIF